MEQSVEVETEGSEQLVDYTQGISLDKGPATPTQDEKYEYSVSDNEVVISIDQVPFHREATASPTGGTTRNKSKRLSEEKSQTSSRPSTPHSDVSDRSLVESVDSRGRRSLRRRGDDPLDR